MLKALFKRKDKNDSAKNQKQEEEFPSMDERPLFDNPKLETLTFTVDGMMQTNERDLNIQTALQQYLQRYFEENAESQQGNKQIDTLTFSSAQVIFFPDADNTEDPYATKVYLDFTFAQLHIGYVPANASALLIDIINGKKARSFKGTFSKEPNATDVQSAYNFHISIDYV